MKTQNIFFCSACGLLVLIFGQGCTSIKSTQLLRATDGKFSACCIPTATRGVPCKFKVETGVRAKITETVYVDPVNGQTVVPENRIYELSTEPVYSDQVFMVHIPRPFAGTLDLTGTENGYHFTSDGYLEKIGGSITDTTIKDLTTILSPGGLGDFIEKTSTPGSDDIQELKRVIAVREFSLSDPNWHVEMNDWINQFNSCHVTGGTVYQGETITNPVLQYAN